MPRSSAPTFPGLIVLLSQLASRAEVHFEKGVKALRLTLVQGRALLIVSENEFITQKDLAQRLGVYASRLVGIIDELEKKNLVKRMVGRDRRTFQLFLTTQGGNKASAVSRLAEDLQDMICGDLTPPERAKLIALLSRIQNPQ